MIDVAVAFGCLVLARVGAFVTMLPLVGGATTPRIVKVGLTAALAVFWGTLFWPQLPACAALVRGETAWLTFPIAVAREILLGATIGYAFGLLMIPARIAGEFLTQELGMSLGSLVNAAGDGMASPLAVLFEMIAAAVFWGLDGHHAFFMVMHGMFVQMPVGAVNIEAPAQHALQAATRTEEWGLMLAAPLAACMFLATIGLTLLGRVAPQLNLYNFGLPMKLGLGLAALLLLLPQTVAALVSLFGHGTSMMGRMAG